MGSGDNILRNDQIWNNVYDEILKRLRVDLDADSTLEPLVVSDPFLSVLDCPDSSNVYEHTFRDGTKKIHFNSGQKLTLIKYNWNKSDLENGIFHTLDEGGEYYKGSLDLTGKTIYFKCDKDNVKIEIEEWL